MRLPSFTRIVLEDFSKDLQRWLPKLIDPLNNFMLTIRNGLNKGLTINDNMSGAVQTTTLKGDSSAAFSYSTGRQPKAVILGGWSDLTDPSWTPSSGLAVQWTYGEGTITVRVHGLNAAHKYSINLVIFDD
jgi:hypothetical protein